MYWHVYQNNKLCIKQNQNIVPSQNKDNNFQDPTWTILFDVHLLRLVASSSPLLPEWGKHMARSPENNFNLYSFILWYNVSFASKTGLDAGLIYSCIKNLLQDPDSSLILFLTVAKTWLTKANWRDWDLFSILSALLY